MKIIGVRAGQRILGGLITQSQKESVVFTRHGRPVAVLRGVEHRAAEDVYRDEIVYWSNEDPTEGLPHGEIAERSVGNSAFGQKVEAATVRRKRARHA